MLTKTKRPGPTFGRRHRVEHDDVGVAHAALVLIGRLHVERHLRVGLQHLLEEEVAGADQRDRDLARRRQHRPRRVVGGEVVAEVQPRRHRAAAVVAERQHDRAPHARLQRDRLLGELAAVDLQREVEGLRPRRCSSPARRRPGSRTSRRSPCGPTRLVMPTFWLRRPTPTQRTRGSSLSGVRASVKAPSVKTWISARGIGADQRPRRPHRLGQPGAAGRAPARRGWRPPRGRGRATARR